MTQTDFKDTLWLEKHCIITDKLSDNNIKIPEWAVSRPETAHFALQKRPYCMAIKAK